MPIIDQDQAIGNATPDDTATRLTPTQPEQPQSDADQSSSDDVKSSDYLAPIMEAAATGSASDFISGVGKLAAKTMGIDPDKELAAIEERNPIGSFLKYGPDANLVATNGYNVLDKIKDTPYAIYAKEAVRAGITNDDSLDQWKQKVDDHEHNEALLATGGKSTLIANLTAGILNPLYAIPIAGEFSAGAKAVDLARTVASFAAQGAGVQLASNVASHATAKPGVSQESLGEGVVASALTMGTLGGAVSYLTHAEMKPMVDYASEVLKTGLPPRMELRWKMPDKESLQLEQGRLESTNNVPEGTAASLDRAYSTTYGEYGKVLSHTNKDATMKLYSSGETVTLPKSDLFFKSPEDIRQTAVDNLKTPYRAAVEDSSPALSTSNDTTQPLAPSHPYGGSSASAGYNTLPDSRIANLGGEKLTNALVSGVQLGGITRPFAKISPGLDAIGQSLRMPTMEGLQSPSPTVRDLTQKLFVADPYLVKNTKAGRFTPTDISVEAKILQDHEHTLSYKSDIDSIYQKYLKSHKDDPNLLSRGDFDTEGATAMWHGDEHDIPEVQEAAQRSRAHIEMHNQKLKEVGELPEDMTIPERGYLTVTHDRDAIIADRKGYEQKVSQYLEKYADMDHEDAEQKAYEIADRIIIGGDIRPGITDKSVKSLYNGIKFTHERELMIPAPDQFPYVKTNMTAIVSQYAEQASRLYHMRTLLNNEVGPITLDYRDAATNLPTEASGKDLIQGLQNGTIIDKGKKPTLPDLIKKLDTEYEQSDRSAGDQLQKNKQLLTDLLDITTGQYLRRTVADNALQHLRAYMYVQMMGGVVLTAISHLGVPVMRYGLGPTLMHGYTSLAADYAKGLATMKLDDMASAGMALERTMSDTIRDLFDPSFTDGMPSKINQIENKAMGIFGKVSGMHYLVDVSRKAGAYMAEHRIVKDIKNYDSLSDAEKTYLASIHIGEEEAKAINAQVEKYGDKETGIANYASWSDQNAKMTMVAAMNKEIRTNVPAAGKGDISFLANRYQAGKNIMQFTNFFSAVTSKVLINGMQRRDANVLQGIIAISTLGSLSYIIKSKLAGKEPDMSANNLITEGLARSGLLGLWTKPAFGSIINILDNKNKNSYNQSPITDLLGPTASDVSGAFELGGSIKDNVAKHMQGKRTNWDSTGSKAIHLMPFQNLWYVRALFNKFNGKH